MKQEGFIFKKAILVAQSDAHVSIERKALRNAGFKQVSIFTSGIDLAYHLSEVHLQSLEREDLIFCQAEFQDMNCIEFIHLMRLHPLLAHQPFIAIAGNQEEALLFEKEGFTFSLLRPLDMNSIQKAVADSEYFMKKEKTRLANSLQSDEDFENAADSQKFYEKLDSLTAKRKMATEKLTALDALHDAMQLIREGQEQKAMPLLAKASVEEHTAPKVFEAMAGIYTKQKNTTQVEKYLKEAIKAHAMIASFERMRDLTFKYKQKFPDKVNPLSEDFVKVFRAGEAKLKNICLALLVLDELYPAKKYFQELYSQALDFGKKELIETIRSTSGRNNDFHSDFDKLEREKNEKPKKSLFNKNENIQSPKQLEIDNKSSQAELLHESIKDKKWEEIGKVSMIDEGKSLDYSFLEPQSQNMFIGIIKGTHQLYKQMNKKNKKRK